MHPHRVVVRRHDKVWIVGRMGGVLHDLLLCWAWQLRSWWPWFEKSVDRWHVGESSVRPYVRTYGARLYCFGVCVGMSLEVIRVRCGCLATMAWCGGGAAAAAVASLGELNVLNWWIGFIVRLHTGVLLEH